MSAAHRISVEEEILIMGFELTDKPITSNVILVDSDNQFVRNLIENA